MRKSVKRGDQGYTQDAHMHKVFLNGAEVKYAHTADEEMGAVWANDLEPTDSLGRLIHIKHLASVPSKRLNGKVVIKKVEQ